MLLRFDSTLHGDPDEPRRRTHDPLGPRRIWRGTILLVVGRLWGSACTFFTLWLLAHHLSAEAFGRYTFYLAVFMLLDTLADFGTGQIAVQRTAHDEAAIPEVLAATRRIRFAMGLLGVVVVGGERSSSASTARCGSCSRACTGDARLRALDHRLPQSHRVGHPGRGARGRGGDVARVRVDPARDGRSRADDYLCAVALGSGLANGILHLVSAKHLPRERARTIPVREIFLVALPLGIAALCQQTYFYVDNLFARRICGPRRSASTTSACA